MKRSTMKKQDNVVVRTDLKEDSLEADLLDCIAGFPLFIQRMREGDNSIGPKLLENLLQLLRRAHSERADLRLLGAVAADMFYKQFSALEVMDGYTRDFCKATISLLFDQLRVRGVLVFYILDNAIREDRFAALTELAQTAGLYVFSPRSHPFESEIVGMIKYHITAAARIAWAACEPLRECNAIAFACMQLASH
jgi:hypothetical protein